MISKVCIEKISCRQNCELCCSVIDNITRAEYGADFDLIEDGEFFRIFSEFVANDAPSSTQLLSISTQDLIPDKKGKYHNFSIDVTTSINLREWSKRRKRCYP